MILFNSKSATYKWLSNMFACDVPGSGGRIWGSSEHLFQACKTTDKRERDRIHAARNGFEAKKRGRYVTLRPDWDQKKLGFMKAVVRQKFTHNPELKEKLLATGEEELVEYAPWGDRFWGVDSEGHGKNHMGKILMELRAELRQ